MRTIAIRFMILICCILFLNVQMWSMDVQIDKNPKPHVSSIESLIEMLPPEVQKIIKRFFLLKVMNEIYRESFPLKNSYRFDILPSGEASCYSTTRKVRSIVNLASEYLTPAQLLNVTDGADCLFDEQLWVATETGEKTRVRYCKDTDQTDNLFFLDFPTQKIKNILFDGSDEQGVIVVGLQHCDFQHSLSIVRTEKGRKIANGPLPTDCITNLFSQSGSLSFLIFDTWYKRIMTTCMHEGRSIVNLYNLMGGQQGSFAFPYEIKKIVSLGKETYIGITEQGRLFTIWFNNNQLLYAMQKHTLQYKDILVAPYVTPTGFYPRLALLTTEHEIFIGDLRHFNRPTLVYVSTLNSEYCCDNQEKFPLFYRINHNEPYQLGIEYRKDGYEKMVALYPDPFKEWPAIEVQKKSAL